MIKKHPRQIILSALLRLSEQAPFDIFTDLSSHAGPGPSGIWSDAVSIAHTAEPAGACAG